MKTGKELSQDKRNEQTFMGRLIAENGKIKLVREAMNMHSVLKITGLV